MTINPFEIAAQNKQIGDLPADASVGEAVLRNPDFVTEATTKPEVVGRPMTHQEYLMAGVLSGGLAVQGAAAPETEE